ncbi:MAG TPA: copper chaperone [Pseudothermotoga sp.]|nr:copper chaperone [Pseudothermotoga sp.]HBT26215.1 copper chaperone [Pseudothermotoga sp.]
MRATFTNLIRRKKIMKYSLRVPDISCQHCKMRISKVFDDIGLKEYEISIEKKTVIVDTEDIKTVLSKMEEIGYPVESYEAL